MRTCCFFRKTADTYAVLSLSFTWLFRRYSSGNGNGRRDGHHSAFGACRRRRTKNCGLCKLIFFSAYERVFLAFARAKRTVANKRTFVVDYSRALVVGAWRIACGRNFFCAFKKGVRAVFNRVSLLHFIPTEKRLSRAFYLCKVYKRNANKKTKN